jgi:pyruvate/2-oxoglutarate dehydrogenase complex dihydrolipoamide acyltransferase (E2) component
MAVPLAVSLSNPKDGQVVIRKITDLTIAVDSRVVPEPYAAKFLAHLVKLLQEPKSLTS